jgi:hypothetical protein
MTRIFYKIILCARQALEFSHGQDPLQTCEREATFKCFPLGKYNLLVPTFYRYVGQPDPQRTQVSRFTGIKNEYQR